MGNFKKIIVAVLICTAAVFCLYSQSQVSNTVSEDQILLSDSATETALTIDTPNFKRTSTVATFVRMIVALIIVIGLIYGVLWFLKKKTNNIKSDDDYLRRAAYINISPSKSIEVITLIDKAYVIGVTEDNITLLGEIDDKELIEAMNINADKKSSAKKPVNFSQVLDSFLIKNKGNIFSEQENKIDTMFQTPVDNSGE